MKFIITENRIKDVVLKYLNNIDWAILESSNETYPLEVFEHNSNEKPTFVVQCVSHRYGDSYNLLINSSFQEHLEHMFGKKTVGEGPDDEPNTLIMDWFNEYFDKMKIEDYLYMDSEYMPHENYR
jgi:hypothetical protein